MAYAPQLAALRARLRRLALVDGLARTALLAGLSVAAALLADRLWFLPAALRAVLALAILAGVAATLWRRLLAPLLVPLPDGELARFAERRCPALGGRLFAVSDGLPLPESERNRLAAALPDARTLVPGRGVARRAVLAGLVALAWAGLALAAPGLAQDGLVRLFAPWSGRDWERFGVLAIRAERAVVAADEPVVVHIERRRGPEAALRLSWSDGAQRGARQLAGTRGPWRAALDLAPGRWTIAAEGGDARPATVVVEVVPRPRLDAVSVRLVPPAYTGLPAQDLAAPPLQALAGSRLELEVAIATAPGRRVERLELAFADAALPAEPAGEGRWRAAFTLRSAGELRIAAEDRDGIALAEPGRFPIALEPDRAPSVSLAGPRPGEAVGARARLSLELSASDDYGLASCALEATVGEGGEPRRLFEEDAAGARRLARRLQLDIAALAGPGARLALVAEARDGNDIGGPGVGRSPPLILQVVDDDELRRDLDRQLGEARERVREARRQLAEGLTESARLPAAARAAAQEAARAAEQLERVLRRWADNQLEPARIAPAAGARGRLAEDAIPQLARAAAGSAEAASAADAALDQAERALDGLLADGDLTRLVARLIERQQALLGETRAFVRAHLARQPDEAGRARQADLAARQRELAAQGAELARRLRAAGAAAVRRVLDEEDPPGAMAAAADEIASAERRLRAPESQQGAIAAWSRILEALSGSDRDTGLGRRLGELAERQERLADSVAHGEQAGAAAEREQARLRQDGERLKGELGARPEAEQALAAAVAAQRAAEQALREGRAGAAAREAAAAAALLRAAQRAVDPRAAADEGAPDVVAALRRLLLAQAKVLSDSLPIHARLGEAPPDFAARRELAAIAALQRDILARLRDEALRPLARAPVATAALGRVEQAMQRVLAHLATPLLGERGIALERQAIAELERLIAIADALAQLPPAEEGGGGAGGGAGGGSGGDRPPFPPAAEIGLLIAEQEEIHAAHAGGAPRQELAERQGRLAALIGQLADALPPGGRGAVLLRRAELAARQAAGRLAEGAGLPQPPFVAVSQGLLQVLAEARSAGSGGGGAPPPPAEGGQDQAPLAGGAAGGQPAGGSGGATAAGGAGGAADPARVRAEQRATSLLQLPPLARERLRQAREQPLPPGALELFERYLERLEER